MAVLNFDLKTKGAGNSRAFLRPDELEFYCRFLMSHPEADCRTQAKSGGEMIDRRSARENSSDLGARRTGFCFGRVCVDRNELQVVWTAVRRTDS